MIKFTDIETTKKKEVGRIEKALPYFYLTVELLVLIYTGSHAWHLANLYTDTVAMFYVQFVGMALVEVAIFYSLFLLHTNRVSDGDQRFATICTFLLGITFVALVVLADTQIVRSTLWHSLSIYLDYIPLAPVAMFVMLFLVNQLDTEKAQQREHNKQRLEQQQQIHLAQLQAQEARYMADLTVIQGQLKVKQLLSEQIQQALTTPDVQELIATTAKNNTPALLSEIGLNVATTNNKPVNDMEVINLTSGKNGVLKPKGEGDHPLA